LQHLELLLGALQQQRRELPERCAIHASRIASGSCRFASVPVRHPDVIGSA
jgi:hypothetical protein